MVKTATKRGKMLRELFSEKKSIQLIAINIRHNTRRWQY